MSASVLFPSAPPVIRAYVYPTGSLKADHDSGEAQARAANIRALSLQKHELMCLQPVY